MNTRGYSGQVPLMRAYQVYQLSNTTNNATPASLLALDHDTVLGRYDETD
jgi:hypothetical protein